MNRRLQYKDIDSLTNVLQVDQMNIWETKFATACRS